MKTVGITRVLASAASVTSLAVTGIAAPATAAPAGVFFSVCGAVNCTTETAGYIFWSNRTARLTGDVIDATLTNSTYTVAVFEAFAGSRKIESQTRTNNPATNGGDPFRGFNFTIGDPDLRGGIDRIKITACEEPGHICGPSENFSKP